jgi:transposase-like protein
VRKPAKILTPSQRERVARLYADGVAVKVIAHQFGIHPTGPWVIARSLGIPRRNVFSKRNNIGNKVRGEFGAPTPHQAGLQSFG